DISRGWGLFPDHDAAVVEVGDQKHVLEDDRRLRSAELVRAVVLDGRTEISLAEHEIRRGVICRRNCIKAQHAAIFVVANVNSPGWPNTDPAQTSRIRVGSGSVHFLIRKP